MPKVLKWLVFTALCALYIWAVFLWDRTSENSGSASNTTTKEFSEVDESLSDDFSETENTPDYINDTLYEEPADFSTELILDEAPIEEYTEPVAQTSSYSFYIISGSYLEEHRAQNAKHDLVNNGVQAEVLLIDTYYKVIVGKYQRLGEAKSALDELSNQGIPAFIQRN